MCVSVGACECVRARHGGRADVSVCTCVFIRAVCTEMVIDRFQSCGKNEKEKKINKTFFFGTHCVGFILILRKYGRLVAPATKT